MSTEYQKQYPENVVPMVRSPKPSEPLPCLTCPPNDELQAIVFDGTNLAVIRGWEWRSNIDLKEFFQPCDNYAEYQIMLPYGDTMTLNYGPISGPTGCVDFLMMYPLYHQTNLEFQTDWKMRWRTIGSTARN